MTTADAVPVHPLASVAVTEYVVVVTGETLTAAEVSEVLHSKELPPLTMSEAVSPLQRATEAGEMTGDRLALTVTVADAVAEQATPLITVTE